MNKKEVWVICDLERQDGRHYLQLVCKAHMLAKSLNAVVSAICLGRHNEVAFESLKTAGAARIIHCECEDLGNAVVAADIVGQLIESRPPFLVIMPATWLGKNIAACLSARFNVGLTADCVNIEVDEHNEVVFSRTALNDSVIARIKCQNSQFLMCTVKPDSFDVVPNSAENGILLERFSHRPDKSAVSIMEIIEKRALSRPVQLNLHAAKLVFSVGRGIGKGKTLDLLHKVAQKFRAEVVGTRAAVESGLIEKSRQVGQSGINISPNIYVSFGVSGASQHVVGMRNSRMIVAVNSDDSAPIFNYADYAFVGDAFEVLKGLDDLIENV